MFVSNHQDKFDQSAYPYRHKNKYISLIPQHYSLKNIISYSVAELRIKITQSQCYVTKVATEIKKGARTFVVLLP